MHHNFHLAKKVTKWTSLPDDIRLRILFDLPLPDAFNANLAFPTRENSLAIRKRIDAIRPLRDAWIRANPAALPSYANPPHLKSREARVAALPLDFILLKTLTIRHADATSLSGIHEFTQLHVLDASHNHLTSLPKSITQCAELRVLHLGFNRLKHFPRLVKQLPRLCTLLLPNNPITTLPSRNWLDMTYLYRLGLFNCELSGPLPEELCKWLNTRTTHGRQRSANLQSNKFDAMSRADLFTDFPHLTKSILM